MKKQADLEIIDFVRKTTEAITKCYNDGMAFVKGSIPWNKGKKLGFTPKYAFKVGEFTGEKNPRWKGDAVGYVGLHIWVKKVLGRPNLCNRCGATVAKRFVWHNISHKYLRMENDWERLCASCHTKGHIASGDIKMNGRGFKKGHSTWNKGLPNPQARNNPQVFKRGQVAWNLGKSWSAETIERIRKAKQNMSVETRLKMSLSARKRWGCA